MSKQKENFFITYLLLLCKWHILLPFLVIFGYWALRKKPSNVKQAQNFFKNFRIGGHRGSPIKQPENTIASMAQAKLEGCDLIEFDVSLTKDGVAVILHDDTLERTTNMFGPIRDVNFERLKACNCAAKFQTPEIDFDTSTFMSVPTLDELVKWAKANQIKMLFDVKDSDQCLIVKIKELFGTYQLYDTAIVSSFFPTVAYRIKHHDQRILTGLTWRRWFCSYADLHCQVRRHNSLLAHILALFIDVLYIWSVKSWLPAFLGVNMMLTYRFEISESYVREQEHAGRKVCAWTVNDESEMIWMNKTLNIPFLTDKPFLAASMGITTVKNEERVHENNK